MWCHRESQSPVCALYSCWPSPDPVPDTLVSSNKLCPLQADTTYSPFKVFTWGYRDAVPQEDICGEEAHISHGSSSDLFGREFWGPSYVEYGLINSRRSHRTCSQWAYPLDSVGSSPIGKRCS